MTNKEAREKLYMEWQKFLEDYTDYTGISEAYKTAFKALEQEPKTGHWILRDVEGVGRIWFCNCSECGKDPQDYISGTEDWWLTKSNLPNYCPHCGSDNREVRE